MPIRRWALVVVCSSFAVACAQNDAADEQTSSPAATDAATATPEDQTWNIDVEVRDGDVVGGPQRVRIDLGDEVVLVVRSDVADEVHVHGYDERADVNADGAVRIAFTADASGLFIAELEERKLKLVELEVR